MAAAATLGGRTAVVTAGASGIGLAIAQCFAERGASVHVLDIDEKAIAALGDGSHPISGTCADMGSLESVRDGFAAALDNLGHTDILVNNAGIGGPRAAIEDITPEDWQSSIDVNLSGAFYAMQAVIPSMKARRDGVILNISTTAARTALPHRTPYVVSKVALSGLAHNAARELGPFNIRVNTILPGLIDNARGRGLLERAAMESGRTVEDITEEAKRFISMRAVMSEEEIAEVALFLASDAARHITAQEISVDGNLEWDI